MMLQTCSRVFQTLLRAEMISRYSYMLLYVMRIINRSVSLILIKYYVMLIVSLILLFMIEDVLCCLCELCFDAEKPVI
jgi:uncharacterized membrane protein